MTPRIPKAADDKEQSKAFLEAAKEHAATGKSSLAERVMRKLAKQPPKPRKKNA